MFQNLFKTERIYTIFVRISKVLIQNFYFSSNDHVRSRNRSHIDGSHRSEEQRELVRLRLVLRSGQGRRRRRVKLLARRQLRRVRVRIHTRT